MYINIEETGHLGKIKVKIKATVVYVIFLSLYNDKEIKCLIFVNIVPLIYPAFRGSTCVFLGNS